MNTKNTRRRFAALILLLTTVLTTNAVVEDQTELERRQQLENNSRKLLEEVISSAWSLKLPENRSFVLANAASLLWTSDQKRARLLYWDALGVVTSMSNANSVATPANASKEEKRKSIERYMTAYILRDRVLRQVARHDPQLALEMLRSSRQVPPSFASEMPYGLPDDSQLEQAIASESVVRDPARALQAARQMLAKGFAFELNPLLHQLIQQDSEKALQLAGDIITKLKTTNLATDYPAISIAMQLVVISRSPERAHSADATNDRRAWLLALDRDQRRELVEMLTTAALSASAYRELLAEISDIMPEIDLFFPERRSALETRLAAFNRTLNKSELDQLNNNSLIRRGLPEELLQKAVEGNRDDRMMLYHQAVLMAVFRNRADSFRDLLGKQISDNEERTRVLEMLDEEQISSAVYRKQLQQLQALLPRIRKKEERARAMAEIAVLLKENGQPDEATRLLDEAATLVKQDLTSESQSNALLALLCAYALVDPPKAFALVERAVDQANQQISTLMLFDKIVKSGAVKKGEIVLEQPGSMQLEFLSFKYGKGLEALAKADFNRTRALADRLNRHELRVMGALMIAKALLQPKNSN